MGARPDSSHPERPRRPAGGRGGYRVAGPSSLHHRIPAWVSCRRRQAHADQQGLCGVRARSKSDLSSGRRRSLCVGDAVPTRPGATDRAAPGRDGAQAWRIGFRLALLRNPERGEAGGLLYLGYESDPFATMLARFIPGHTGEPETILNRSAVPLGTIQVERILTGFERTDPSITPFRGMRAVALVVSVANTGDQYVGSAGFDHPRRSIRPGLHPVLLRPQHLLEGCVPGAQESRPPGRNGAGG